ncbi:MAG: EAL domain-containing response regulator [Gammaproteobacteria bacterium]|nr:EAL domain-containing response regulator [Gammaproteobacteria bacterium]
MTDKNQHVVIVDDDPHYAELLGEMLSALDCLVTLFTSPVAFLESDIPGDSIVLLDLKMPQLDGVEVIREMAARKITARIVLISGYDSGVLHSAQQLAKAHRLNVVDRLTKPVMMKDLKTVLANLEPHQIPNNTSGDLRDGAISVSELREAIRSEQLELHYQPQINMKSGELVGAEALVRWRHPHRGLVFPNQFVPFAENNHLIGDLTARVIRMAVEQTRYWGENNLKLRVSVNVSAENISSLALPEQLSRQVEQHQLDPSMLTLEVTESALMNQRITSLDILTRLRMKGFKLSIDDFGTGYSSLSQLHRIPFTELKIDQGFVMDIDHDEESRAIVETCVMLGHKLKMNTVAEGVETQKVWDLLKEMGCETAQGYFIARPMPADKLLSWYDKYSGSPDTENIHSP